MLSADDPPGDAHDRTAPNDVGDQDQDAEHATVAALLLAGPKLQLSILQAIRPEDFDDVRSRFVVTLAAEMLAAGEPLDPITLIGHVTREAKLAAGIPRAGMYSFVAGLTTNAVVVPASGPWYAASVVERAARGKVNSAGEQ